MEKEWLEKIQLTGLESGVSNISIFGWERIHANFTERETRRESKDSELFATQVHKEAEHK
jgi:hypothetical protein